ncbi:prenyltransferase/squalene oxidase repeat-containing protein [Streptomyces luteireticuli]|uniref:prenyltransferase/squalene oxidase repeat-containing protein n=1 Tax=Streptomyces luteireticuli TaxID=173858 RepID=UPI003557F6EB
MTEQSRLTPSVYETGRVVSLLPELARHSERVTFLLATQKPEGHWGPHHAGYALIPTLSAIEALLAVRLRNPHDARITSAARSGVRSLADLAEAQLPDLPAADLIVAMLVPRIEQHLNGNAPLEGAPLRLPDQLLALACRSGRLTATRALLSGTARIEPKLLHAAETFGECRWPDRVQPTEAGGIGASPAASAAWLAAGGSAQPGSRVVRRYLRRAMQQHGGPLPCVWPAAVFERAWVLNWLLHSGISLPVPPHLRRGLRESLGPEGAATALGLPPDADTTSMVLATLTLLDEPLAPTALLRYELDTHFCTWPGEQGQSVTTNAHVLEALGLYVLACPAEKRRYARLIRKVSGWLRDRQLDSGAWDDRWHASPYYATFSAALALHRFGVPDAASSTRTVQWLMETQHDDGSWGIWGGTAEETAYAVLLLARLPASGDARCQNALNRARPHLACTTPASGHPPLWHDKDLYTPNAIVSAALLAAGHEVRTLTSP